MLSESPVTIGPDTIIAIAQAAGVIGILALLVVLLLRVWLIPKTTHETIVALYEERYTELKARCERAEQALEINRQVSRTGAANLDVLTNVVTDVIAQQQVHGGIVGIETIRRVVQEMMAQQQTQTGAGGP